MICSCCGFEIDDKAYSIENGKKNVCEKCWNDSNLFFPEKIQSDEKLTTLARLAAEGQNQQETIEVKVIKLEQKDTRLYTGKMKVKDILDLSELDKFKEEELEGYQREQYEERISELVRYLTNCPLAIMPAILVSLRDANFISKDGDFGVLKIPRSKGSIWMIDGQHRLGGFGKIRNKFLFSKDISPTVFLNLMSYEFPVVFVDSNNAAHCTATKLGNASDFLSSEDIERTIFFIVNKTQKGISSSLKDALLYRIDRSGIQGLPMIEKERWRIAGAEVGISLNSDNNSPLKDKINISGKTNSGKPIQLNSFVSSLEPLLLDADFSKLRQEHKRDFLMKYWLVLKKMFPDALDKKTEKQFMLLKALGLYSIHCVAKDIFKDCLKQNCDYLEIELLSGKLSGLKSFDWSVKTSPLSSLGGMKGVGKAHELLGAALKNSKEASSENQTRN